MKIKILWMTLLGLALVQIKAENIEAGKILFEDKFDGAGLKSDWIVENGKWEIKNGTLFNNDGGNICIKKMSSNFILDAEVKVNCDAPFGGSERGFFVVFDYEDKSNRSFLILDPDQKYYYIRLCEYGITSTKSGGVIPFDKENFHKIKIICMYNEVSFYWDGLLISSVRIDCSSAQIAFSCGNFTSVEIKSISMCEIKEKPVEITEKIKHEDIARGELWDDYKFRCTQGKPLVFADSKLLLPYDFRDRKDFRGAFVRIPVNIKDADRICLDVEGDSSMNKFFMIVHDCSGEQHLVYTKLIADKGFFKVKVNMNVFKSAPPYVVTAQHWGGDMNQKIDFPIQKLDIGVCKSSKAIKEEGCIGISNLRTEK